jgi:Uma2 family endonuclease
MLSATRAPEIDPDSRLEVHAGRVVAKERPSFEHGHAQAGLVAALRGPFHRPAKGTVGGWWLTVEAEIAYPGWTFLHDVAGWKRESLGSKPSGQPVYGPPDWVAEILGVNRRHDVVTKFDVLGQAGVRHYWLVDVDAREIVVHRREEQGWFRVGAFLASQPGERARIEPFDAVELEIGVLLGDDPAE